MNSAAAEVDGGGHEDLGSGAAGTALAHIARAQANRMPPVTARAWLRTMVSKPVTATAASSLYFGAPAVAFVLHVAAHPAFNDMLGELDTHIRELTALRLTAAYERIERGEFASMREYDLISGLTGLGAYHLVRHGHDDPTLRAVLTYLVALSEPVYHFGESLPGCWTATSPTGRIDPHWPNGHVNLGMAHGVSGVLALLSSAMTRGTHIDGLAKAIGELCRLLDRHQIGSGPDTWWPGTVSFNEYTQAEIGQRRQPRPSWCYGTPGHARAQHLAGHALDDQDRIRSAEQALAGCVADRTVTDQLTDASLCHGWAGLVHALRCTQRDAHDPELIGSALRTAQRGLEDHLARFGPPASTGLLEGTPGILLAQHTHPAGSAPAWDACLLTTL